MLCICHMVCTKKLIGQSDFKKKNVQPEILGVFVKLLMVAFQ